MPITWSSEKLEISSVEEMETRFFVRVDESEKQKIQDVFGEVEMIDAGVGGECGFITPSMKEKEFAKKAEAFAQLITRIRVMGDE